MDDDGVNKRTPRLDHNKFIKIFQIIQTVLYLMRICTRLFGRFDLI